MIIQRSTMIVHKMRPKMRMPQKTFTYAKESVQFTDFEQQLLLFSILFHRREFLLYIYHKIIQ
jgi:hypothetical protein